MATYVAKEVIEESDRWILPFEGRTVTRCLIDFRFTLQMWQPDETFEVAIGSPFRLTLAGHDYAIDPEAADRPAGLAPALAVFNKTIPPAYAEKSGCLHLEFEDGDTLPAPPDAAGTYEAWEAGGRTFKIVCTPDGDLAVWSER